MNILQIKIINGYEDKRLLEHIKFLEDCQDKSNGSAGISEGERTTLDYAYARLELITRNAS